MHISQATDSDKEAWDSFVNNHPESTPYHLTAWSKAVQNAYGFQSVNLIAKENDQVTGVFPVTMFKIPFRQPELVALPYCDVGSMLTTNIEVQNQLLNKVISIAQEQRASVIDIRGTINSDLSKICQYPIQNSNGKVRMLLDLPDSADELSKSFKSKLRSQIRKSEKNGLTFQLTNKKLDDFYSVFSLNMRDLGSPVHSKKWFTEIIKQFKDNAKIGLVYHDNKAIGAGIILLAGNKVSIPWASTLREHNRLGPNMLLYWKFLEYAADNKCNIFDFGRSTPDEGTYRFKAQWGAKPAPLPWHKIFLQGKPSPESSEPSKNRERIATIWQKLPPNIATYLGPKIRKYISL